MRAIFLGVNLARIKKRQSPHKRALKWSVAPASALTLGLGEYLLSQRDTRPGRPILGLLMLAVHRSARAHPDFRNRGEGICAYVYLLTALIAVSSLGSQSVCSPA